MVGYWEGTATAPSRDKRGRCYLLSGAPRTQSYRDTSKGKSETQQPLVGSLEPAGQILRALALSKRGEVSSFRDPSGAQSPSTSA